MDVEVKEKTKEEVIDKEEPKVDEPAVEEPKQEPVKQPDADRLKELEIEKARLEGELAARREEPKKETPEPMDPQEAQYQQTKQIVSNDASAMDEDAFNEKYKMSKSDARMYYVQAEQERERVRNAEERSLLRAENTVAKKYGEKFTQYEKDIADSVRDLDPSVRQNPERLARHMERSLKALVADEKPEPKSPKSEKPIDGGNRIVDTGFVEPNVIPDAPIKKENKDDLIAEPDRKLAARFGIEKESDRKKWADSPYCPIEFGSGLSISDPAKGIEREKNAS